MFPVTDMQGGLYLSKGTGKAILGGGVEHILLKSVNFFCFVTAIALLLQLLFFAPSLYATFILLFSIYGHNM